MARTHVAVFFAVFLGTVLFWTIANPADVTTGLADISARWTIFLEKVGVVRPVVVAASAELAPVPSDGDAADDPAIWVHPTDPTRSTIIGTDKLSGLLVYDLSGEPIQHVTDGKMINVDVRYGFPLDGSQVAVVTAGNRTSRSIAVYQVNPTTRELEDVAARTISTGVSPYGSCMYRSAITGKYYVFVDNKRGMVEQWELFDDGSGRVDGRRVRRFDVGSEVEGCVADDDLGYLYISEEDVGIWKYGAEPWAGIDRTMVDATGSDGHLTADVEGLTIYHAGNSKGYLLASSQGSNSFAVYQREGENAYVMTFTIAAGNRIDRVSNTDGIDVTSAYLGPAFPQGLFVAQDDRDGDANQNFKLVPWQTIASASRPSLLIDPSWSPYRMSSPAGQQ
ncbi:MAG: phytase [Chloroflexi bacterium]|nr:phytase [Chloroflexota bacterium]